MTKIKGIKGFDKDLKCRGLQYEIGKTYECEGKIKACLNGFHSIPEDESPLNVFEYYPPVGDDGAPNRYCAVESDGDIDKKEYKIATSKLTVDMEIGIPAIVDRHIEWAKKNLNNERISEEMGYRSAATNIMNRSAAINTGNASVAANTGNYSAATNTGGRSAATNTGYGSAATSTGYRSAATDMGDRSAATNSGKRSAAINTGNHSAATNSGNRSAAINTGNYSGATNTGDHSAATNTGDHSAATNTGNYSAAISTGYGSAAKVKGKGSVAIACGIDGKARASLGSAIVIAEHGEWDGEAYPLVGIKSAIVDGVKLKPDTWYTLKDGEFVECE